MERQPYAYDWRKDIDEASDGLAALIRSRFGREPVHLVAHSMGGLVARNFIRRHPRLWESMRDPALIAGGRLVMLGTPNYGSYAIVQVLTGADPLLGWLVRFDLGHNLTELLEITNTFLGTYMLLPAPEKLPPELTRLYERSAWGETPGLEQRHLERTHEFYKALDTPETIDPARMVYVAGCDQVTISSVKLAAPGEFEYEFTRDGDGRVPHALGLLPGVPAYYVDEVHGDLARNENVLRSLDSLLQTGKTHQLAAKLPARGRRRPDASPADAGVPPPDAWVPSLRSYRLGPDRVGLEALGPMAARVRGARSADALSESDKQIAADALIHAALGARSPLLSRAQKREDLEPSLQRSESVRHKVTLRVGVRYGAIEAFRAPLVVVGHYRGVKPVRAIGAINKKLRNWIGRAVKRGMISGDVGETFFVPTRGSGVRADGVVVAGMGDYGRFTAGSLRRIMANVAQGIAALRLREAASVLVGAGDGALDEESALRAMLEGFGGGLVELAEEEPKTPREVTLWIVELDPKRFVLLDGLLGAFRDRHAAGEQRLVGPFRLDVVRALPAERRRANAAHRRECARELANLKKTIGRDDAANRAGGDFNEIRLTVEFDRERGAFNFSALTKKAVVSARKIAVTKAKAEDAARALAEAQTRKDQLQFGRLLFNYVIPEDFEDLFASGESVRLIVDPTTAALPWEMACTRAGHDRNAFRWLGTDHHLTRQFRTLLSRPPSVAQPRSDQIRALVIADPAKDPDWQLPGARAEGRLVAKLLRGAAGSLIGGQRLDIVVEDRIGPSECDATELHALLTNGDFDLVHFAGHGDYNKDDPERSGWVLEAERLLSASDILRARRVPWLIVANACFSGALRESEPYPDLDVARRGASIAEAFMERGVQNYLGTGWTVDDAQAATFAKVFYGALLGNELLKDALAAARAAVFREPIGSTWGAYHFYGDPSDLLVPRARVNAA